MADPVPLAVGDGLSVAIVHRHVRATPRHAAKTGWDKSDLATAVGSDVYAQGLDPSREFEKPLISNKVTSSFSQSPCRSISREPVINLGAVELPREFVPIKARMAVHSGDSWQDPQRRAGRI